MPIQLLKLSIVYKIGLLFVLLSVLTASVVAVVFYDRTRDIITDDALQNLSWQLQREGRELNFKTNNLRKHVLFLSGTPPIQGIIEAMANGGRDSQDNTTEQWRQRLAVIFSNLSKTNPEYLQVRYLAANGDELVRVNNNNGQIEVVTEQLLQNKAGREYVTKTLALPSGEVYVSDVSLNREFGRLSVPFTPVLRLATPIYQDDGSVFGLIIINMNFGNELENIRQVYQGKQETVHVTDFRGSYLLHPDREKEFGFDRGRRYRIQEDFPKVAAFLLPGDKRQLITVKDEENDRVAVLNKVLLTDDPEKFILLVLSSSYTAILQNSQTALRDTVLLTMVVIIIGAVLAFLFAHSISQPVKQLTKGVENFKASSDRSELPVERHDELGLLARAFSELMEYVVHSQNDLRQLNQNLESLVAERTRQATNAQIRTQTIMDTVVDGIITIDDHGIVQTFNHAAETLFGYRASEVVGRNIKMLMPEKYSHEHDAYLQHHRETGEEKIIGASREVSGLRKDGEVFPLELSVSQMRMGSERLFTGIVRDITERKRIEVMKNEFISTVSHELRTPLTSIRGALGLITGGAVGELSEKLDELLQIASNNTQRLLLLINDILDLQKIEAGNMAFRFGMLDLGEFVSKAIEDNATYGKDNNVTFKLVNKVEDARVFADQARLMQVLTNLMSNAAKFSPLNGVVELTIVYHEGMYRVSVSDNGPGIPESFQEKMFDKFSQADSSATRKIGGTGLGLNIARLLIEKHGGRIGFVSREGVGSTFYFELPELCSDVASIEPGELSRTVAEHSPCILIVEDDRDIAAIMQRQFSEAGFNSIVAASVAAAIGVLSSEKADLKLMTLDVQLPDGNGIQLLEYVRNHDRYRDLPVVVVSVDADIAKREVNGSAIGVIDWISKPVDEKRLIRAVRAAATDNEKPRVLHVEDDSDVYKLVSLMLEDHCELSWASSLASAREMLEQQEFDLVLLDVNLPDGSGLELVDVIDASENRPNVVIFSAQDTLDEYADRVEAVLVKSHTTDKQLVSTILSSFKNS